LKCINLLQCVWSCEGWIELDVVMKNQHLAHYCFFTCAWNVVNVNFVRFWTTALQVA